MQTSEAKTSMEIQDLINLELETFFGWQKSLQALKEGSLASWLFEMKSERQKLIMQLISENGKLKNRNIVNHQNSIIGELKDFSIPQVIERLKRIEMVHQRNLEIVLDDYFCPAETSRLIRDKLLPLANNNLKKLEQAPEEEDVTSL